MEICLLSGIILKCNNTSKHRVGRIVWFDFRVKFDFLISMSQFKLIIHRSSKSSIIDKDGDYLADEEF